MALFVWASFLRVVVMYSRGPAVEGSEKILRAALQSDSRKIEPVRGMAREASRPQIKAVASASRIVLRGVSCALYSIIGTSHSFESKIQKE